MNSTFFKIAILNVIKITVLVYFCDQSLAGMFVILCILFQIFYILLVFLEKNQHFSRPAKKNHSLKGLGHEIESFFGQNLIVLRLTKNPFFIFKMVFAIE